MFAAFISIFCGKGGSDVGGKRHSVAMFCFKLDLFCFPMRLKSRNIHAWLDVLMTTYID